MIYKSGRILFYAAVVSYVLSTAVGYAGEDGDSKNILEIIAQMRANNALVPPLYRKSLTYRSVTRREDPSLGTSNKEETIKFSMVVDGDKFDITQENWVGGKYDQLVRLLYFDEDYYHYYSSPKPPEDSGVQLSFATSDIAKNAARRAKDGYSQWRNMPDSNLDLSRILEQDVDNLRLSPEMESIDGFPCYVIEGDTKWGYYKLWVDPENGHGLRKGHLHKGPQHLSQFGTPLSETLHRGNQLIEYDAVFDGVSIKNVEGYHFLERVHRTETHTYMNGGRQTFESEGSLDDLDLHPNLQSLDVFNTDFIPDGIQVRVDDIAGVKYEWRNGQIAPILTGALNEMIDESVGLIDRPEPTTDVAPDASPPAAFTFSVEQSPNETNSDRTILISSAIICVVVLVLIGVLLRRKAAAAG